MSTLQEILEKYNGNPESLDIPKILGLFTERYPAISTRAKEFSKYKRKLMEKTPVIGYNSGYEYNVIMRKQKKQAVLIGKLNEIKLPKVESDKLAQLHKQRNEERVIHENVISKAQVDELIGMIKSDDIIDNMIALAICTGRRSTEVTKTGIFKKIQNDATHVKFQGALKNPLNTEKSFIIPIIGNSSEILKAYRRIRKESDATGLDIEQTIKIYGNRMLKRLKKINNNLTVHSLRSIYVSYLYQYLNPTGHSKTHMIQNYLCHDSQECTVNYNNWVIE